MIIDNSKVYTAVNADALHKGDIVYLADTMSRLKFVVNLHDKNYFKTLDRILNEEERHRFVDENYLTYNLAYLVCPARNAEAFKAWHKGKKIEKEWVKPGKNFEWREFQGNPNWYVCHYRPAQEKTTEYRAFASIDELTTEFVKRFKTKTPSYAQPLIWVKSSIKGKNDRYLITGYVDNEDYKQLVAIDNKYYCLCVLFENFQFLDGSPCGVKD